MNLKIGHEVKKCAFKKNQEFEKMSAYLKKLHEYKNVHYFGEKFVDLKKHKRKRENKKRKKRKKTRKKKQRKKS